MKLTIKNHFKTIEKPKFVCSNQIKLILNDSIKTN